MSRDDRDLPATGRGWKNQPQRTPKMHEIKVKRGDESVDWKTTSDDYPLTPAMQRKLAREKREREGRG